MKNFEMLRYLSKWKYLIFGIAIVGCILVYFYAVSKQIYTAETVIRYSNPDASLGYTPNGSPIDVNEIYSAKVISNVLEDLNLKTTTDNIRSKCTVKGIISDDELERKKAILEKGEEYTYFPTDYSITFSVSSDYTKSYATDVLDSIIKNYFTNYGEKYINQSTLPNNTANFSESDYDFIESAEILDHAVRDVMGYLKEKQEDFPNYRSAATGYTFADLYNMYNSILNYDIPHIYTQILEQKTSKDLDVLIKKYQNDMHEAQRSIDNLEEEIANLTILMNRYSDKSKESIEYHYSGDESDSSYILKDVYENDEVVNTETTYDTLINQYVDLKTNMESLQVDIQRKTEILHIFTDSPASKHTTGFVSDAVIAAELAQLSDTLTEMYNIITPTVDEFNQYQGAANITTMTSIRVDEKINVKLYMALALVVFFGIGCVGAIVLGRLGDFIENALYIDKKTGLPNRARCDLIIAQYSRSRLQDNFSFVLFRINNLKQINQEWGHEKGDELLKVFGSLLDFSFSSHGFVGYNSSDQFICFFENCTLERAEAFVAYFRDTLAIYMEENREETLAFSYAIAETRTEKVYSLRELMGIAFHRINTQNNIANTRNSPEPQG